MTIKLIWNDSDMIIYIDNSDIRFDLSWFLVFQVYRLLPLVNDQQLY